MMQDTRQPKKRPDVSDGPSRAIAVAEDFRDKAIKVCLQNGQTSDEALLFMQMLGLVDDFGIVIDAQKAPRDLHVFNGNIVADKR